MCGDVKVIVKQRYEVGGLYKEPFPNLDLIGSYAGEIKLLSYNEDWLKYTLRFKKFDNELPPSYLCSEIYNQNHHLALKSLDTLVIVPDKGLIERTGDWLMDKLEKGF